jgi:hypothetical protein
VTSTCRTVHYVSSRGEVWSFEWRDLGVFTESLNFAFFAYLHWPRTTEGSS